MQDFKDRKRQDYVFNTDQELYICMKSATKTLLETAMVLCGGDEVKARKMVDDYFKENERLKG